MTRYVVLLRGINVGGKNTLPMAELRTCLQELGFADVATYINSGNALVSSELPASEVRTMIERELPRRFELDSALIKILVLTPGQLQAVVDDKPAGFGDQPDTYHSDVIFLIELPVDQAMPVFKPRDGVDRVWPGQGVVYSQRLSAERTKSRLNAIIGTPAYQSMTIRTWNTMLKLLQLLRTDAKR